MAQGVRLPDRFCEVCGKQLARRSPPPGRRNLCVTHAAQDPARRAKLAATQVERHKDPVVKKMHRDAGKRIMRKLMADPEHAARLREQGRRTGLQYGGYTCPPEVRARAAREDSERRLAHIPLPYRDLYQRLMVSKGLSKPERIKIVQGQIAADAQRVVAADDRALEARRRAVLGDDYDL